MENKIMELLMKNGQVSLVHDVMPLAIKEIPRIDRQACDMTSDFIEQQLYAGHIAGVSVVCVPQFSLEPQTSSMHITDMIYKVVTVGSGTERTIT